MKWHRAGLLVSGAIVTGCASMHWAPKAPPGAMPASETSLPVEQQGVVNAAVNALSGISVTQALPLGFIPLMALLGFFHWRSTCRIVDAGAMTCKMQIESTERMVRAALKAMDES